MSGIVGHMRPQGAIQDDSYAPPARSGGLALLRSQEPAEAIRAYWTAEKKALNDVAAVLLQEGELLGAFHALGHDLELQAVRHSDNGLGDGGVLGIARQVLDEGPVDFEGVQRETLQVGQRRVAGAEVVYREPYPHVLEFVQRVQRCVD